MWGLRFVIILIVIAITHLLAFQPLITPDIAPGLVPLADLSIGVCPTATGAGVLIIAAAAAATLGPATGVLIIAPAAAAALGPATGVLIIAAAAAAAL
jgi:hypothetical protein